MSLATFVPLVGEAFEVESGSGPLILELIEAEASPSPPGAPREAFRLLFLGPAEPILPQATYGFTHPPSAALEIFIVPIAADPDGVRYEAIFA